MNVLRKCTAEFIGTFAIVFGGCGAVAINQISNGAITHYGIATTFGLVVMVMIYATGHISGAHFNPAVTLAFAVTRHFPKHQILPYWIAQTCGALTASLLHHLTLPTILAEKFPHQVLQYGTTLPIDDRFLTAFVWEIILTFFLMFVIMAVATDYRATGQVAGLSIGSTVWFLAIFAGPLSGASMNPARSLAPALFSGQTQHLLAYLIAPILGAILGALAYNFIRCSPNEQREIKGCC